MRFWKRNQKSQSHWTEKATSLIRLPVTTRHVYNRGSARSNWNFFPSSPLTKETWKMKRNHQKTAITSLKTFATRSMCMLSKYSLWRKDFDKFLLYKATCSKVVDFAMRLDTYAWWYFTENRLLYLIGRLHDLVYFVRLLLFDQLGDHFCLYTTQNYTRKTKNGR